MFTDTIPSTVTQWIKLLSISTLLSFSRLRERAISELSTHYHIVDPVQKIVLAEDFHVPEWKKPAYMELVQRAELIQYEEAIRLGPKTSHGLYMAREEARKDIISSARHCSCQGGSLADVIDDVSPSLSSSISSSGPFSPHNISGIIDRIFFQEELEAEEKMIAENQIVDDERSTPEKALLDHEKIPHSSPLFGFGITKEEETDEALPEFWRSSWTIPGGTLLVDWGEDKQGNVFEFSRRTTWVLLREPEPVSSSCDPSDSNGSVTPTWPEPTKSPSISPRIDEPDEPGSVVNTEEEIEWTVDSIVDERRKGRVHQYLVRWEGCGPEEDSWLPRQELEGCSALDEWLAG
jgi:hypothetical protein